MEQNRIGRSMKVTPEEDVPLAAESESGAPDMHTSLCILLFRVASIIMWVKNRQLDSRKTGS